MKNKSKTVQAVMEKKDFSEYDKTKATPLGKKMIREAETLIQELNKKDQEKEKNKKTGQETERVDSSENTTAVAKPKNPFRKIKFGQKQMDDFWRCMTDPNMTGPRTEEEFKEWWEGLIKPQRNQMKGRSSL